MLRLFTKTYANDYPWLKLAIKSVLKLSTDPVDWTFVGDHGSRQDIENIILEAVRESGSALKYNIVEVYDHWPEVTQIPGGYLAQQWVKMNAHLVMGDGVFWNWDCDVIATKPFSSQSFTGKSGRPIYWFSQFNSIMDGPDRPAHEARIAMMKEVLDIREAPFEWMRCMPIPMFAEILKCGARRREWQKSFEWMKSGRGGFSEFNIIGQFSQIFFPDAYEWTNAEAAGPTWSGGYVQGGVGSGAFQQHALISQCWSYGGIPQHITDFVNGL